MDFNDILQDFENEVKVPKLESDQERSDDVRKLTNAWIQERAVPELLPYEGDLLDRLLNRVRKQLEFIEVNSIELPKHEGEIKLLLVIVENELDRVQFVIRSYVRTRLTKIDEFAIFLRSSDEELAKLSTNETVYMEKHLELLMDLYNRQFLSNMPVELQALDEVAAGISMVDQPDYDRPVFIKCRRNKEVIIDDEEVELTQNASSKASAFGIFCVIFFTCFAFRAFIFLGAYLEQRVFHNYTNSVIIDKEDCTCDPVSDSDQKFQAATKALGAPIDKSFGQIIKEICLPGMNEVYKDVIRLLVAFVVSMLGYALMLAAMSFFILYFFAVCLGLAFGEVFFNRLAIVLGVNRSVGPCTGLH
ncbi:hypothetical protein FOA43_004324 [Brettanomyces nanus]|uniref:Copper transport protein n=1 Tax=Eeniella nana TaxID=13502 RepID=A0A875RQH0_EENNA|nr:uncharacterized protein FOA43_004324 [Brettanomyces nanus]QPG76930.1 hypothetical protein FOA43_004324 [Brettanomyces nanus]